MACVALACVELACVELACIALACIALACVAVGCEPVPVIQPARSPRNAGTTVEPVRRRFAFEALDGETVSSSSMRGRMTVVLLLATYDDGSQAQARFLKSVVRTHAPRINALGVVVELPENLPLVRIFAESLDLPYPVALAGADTLSDSGPFPGLKQVPSLVLLDRDGNEVWRHTGVIESARLSEVIAEHDSHARD